MVTADRRRRCIAAEAYKAEVVVWKSILEKQDVNIEL
jgi:hypothetical protein